MQTVFERNGASYARARHDVPLSIVERAVRPLKRTPLQRILLVTDGTVTEILEAYTGESMALVKLGEAVVEAAAPIPGLHVDRGERVLHREILLRGKMSLTNFLYAESFIAVDRLDEALRNGLLKSRKPIGFLIQEQRMETYREILGCGRELAGSLAHHFDIDPHEGMIWRTYRIFYQGQPIMQITEKFPESHFPD